MTGCADTASCELPDGQGATGILAFSGSSRGGSFNSRLLDAAVSAIAALDADVSLLDLRDLELPLFDPDIPPVDWPLGVRVFRQLLSAHDGLVITTPEYNGSLPPLLKNALDWSLMARGGANSLAPYRGKVAAIISVTVGDRPSTYCLAHLRAVLSTMGVFVLPEELSFTSAGSGFENDGLCGVAIGRLQRQMAALVCELRSPRIWIDAL